MVKVWAARITPLFDKTNYAFYYEKLPEWRKEKAERLKSENAKARVWEHGLFGPGCSNRRSWEKIHLLICPLRGICAVRLQ